MIAHLLIATMTLAAAPKRKPLELTFWPSMTVVKPVSEERAVIRDVPEEAPAAAAPADAGTSAWTVAWERPFPNVAESVELVAVNGKIFTSGGDSSALLNPDGGSALTPMPRLPRGRVFADPSKERVFLSGDGVTELAGATTRFLQPLPGVPANLIVSGERLLAWGDLAGQHPHGGPIERRVSVAVLDLNNASAHVPKITVEGISDLAVAANADTIAIALPGELHFVGWDLAKGRALTSPEAFTPMSMSLDARGRAWLVVAIEKRVELWVVEADGQRRMRTRLPLERAPKTPTTWTTAETFLAWPPQFDSRGRAYVETRRRLPTGGLDGVLFAFTPSGAIAWNRGHNGGMALKDDRVLLTELDSLFSIDPTGGETLLYRAAELIVTAPVLVGDGLTLATTKKLLFLSRSGTRPSKGTSGSSP